MLKRMLIVVGLVGVMSIAGGLQAQVITFDDLPGADDPIPNGYEGFNWNNFYYLDVVNYDGDLGGYVPGMVSPNNVAYNAWGNPAAVMGVTNDQDFDFVGAYLTAAWKTGLSIDVEGYRDGALVYSDTVVVDCFSATWFEFNFTNIDELQFRSYGGTEYPGYSGSGEHFAMDNITFGSGTPIPEPLTMIAVFTGVIGLARYARKRRTA